MALEGRLTVDVEADAVSFAFTVTNVGDASAELRFRTGQVADVAVFDDGEEVWRWSAGRGFTQALVEETLAAGASETVSMTWPSPSPGAYVAIATLEAENADVEDRAAFEF